MQQAAMVEIENSVAPSSASGESINLLTVDDNREKPVETPPPPAKKKRNLPGMPDPDAEVIALSPTTLMATNRFVCEICNKGFQRDQNLQLHRRGHNLPWKLRQRTSKEPKKRVYVCPEPSCIHHDPSRALGDLTGIKKHFCRKHGEKKYKCERCSKKYAVQSDWKAHMKTCGTREYPCDCGTVFSRRDSFITHRAFCDALAQESARSSQPLPPPGGDFKVQLVSPPPPPPPAAAAASSPPPPPLTPSTGVLSPVLSIQSSAAELPENQVPQLPPPGPPPLSIAPLATTTARVTTSSSSTSSGNKGSAFAGIFNSSNISDQLPQSPQQPPTSYSGLLRPAIDPMSLSLSSSLYGGPSIFPSASQSPQPHYLSRPQPVLSATALLQKAAQMGATSSNSSFLRGLGLALPSSSSPQSTMASASTSTTQTHWSSGVKLESNSLAFGLGLGLPSSGPSGFNELMMSQSTLFGSKPATLDFLGLGMGAREASSGGFSAFLSSIGSGINIGDAPFGGVGSGGDVWDDQIDRKPSMR